MLRRHIDAAHQLPYHTGKCRRLHGHRFTIDVTISGEPQADSPNNPESGMLVDFGRVKVVIDAVLPDHLSLNRVGHDGVLGTAACLALTTPDIGSRWYYAMDNPTAERLAKVLYDVLAPQIAELVLGIAVTEVTVWETPDACASYP
jgi:6-pyruvoyltetrahydropterin/6-carboxytetrahydropterin synthase